MPRYRIALANIASPNSEEESISLVQNAMSEAAQKGASLICFPECIIPGYGLDNANEKLGQEWLNESWSLIDSLASKLNLCVILGTERLTKAGRLITARVTNPDGSLAGFQDKVQLDPSEERTFVSGAGRHIFQHHGLKFGVVICHEGWRYPETVRWAARNGAHVVFHPHFEIVENEDYLPKAFADPSNSFHEKAALCRAAENGCYFATVNCALKGATTTSAIIDPEGVVITHQPYGQAGLLFGEIETEQADRFLAQRLRPID